MSPQTIASVALTTGLLCPIVAPADPHVVVVSWADDAYVQRRNSGTKPRDESYVVMQGNRFPGTTLDRSLEKLDFMQVAQSIGVEIAQSHYLPAKDLESADLLLVVHWGVTTPHESMESLRGTTNTGIDPRAVEQAAARGRMRAPEDPSVPSDPANAFFVDSGEPYRAFAFDEAERVSDEYESRFRSAGNAALLGYTSRLRKLSRMPMMSAKEESLMTDLKMDRYFVIIHAFDLKAPRPEGGLPRKPVWKLHLNMRSPGQSFRAALSHMSTVAREFAGRNLDEIETVLPTRRSGSVEIGDLMVIGVVD